MGVLEILGIVASLATITSGLGWVLDRNAKRYQEVHTQTTAALTQVMGKIETIDSTLTNVRLELPQRYVAKEELLMHIEGERHWHESVDRRLEDIRGEISSLREWRHHS